jgi:hypothetical protein
VIVGFDGRTTETYLQIIKAQEESDLRLCWTYLAAAFNMCQMMGYHRSSALNDDPVPLREAKRHVFWSLYTIDKNLSLNLGVTSHFQDHDIDVEHFTPSRNPQLRPWDLMALVIIRFSAFQGQVYDKLYSASASKMPPDQKAGHIVQLSTDLVTVRDELLAVLPQCLTTSNSDGADTDFYRSMSARACIPIHCTG